MQLLELDKQIKSAESSKSTGLVLMVVSLVILWPLLVVGGIMFASANSKIKDLESQKQRLLSERIMYAAPAQTTPDGIV